VKQATFFYKIHIDKGNFNNQKAFYKGGLLSLEDMSDESEEVEADDEEEARRRTRGWLLGGLIL